MWSPRPLTPLERRPTLDGAALVHVPRLLTEPACAELVARVMAAESEWTEDFGGDQFSLGLAFYTHYESGRARHYFRDAARANARVERVLPGVQEGVRALFQELVGEPTVFRPGWCGPGVHVFVADSPVGRGGGSVHFDLEGLRTEAERRGPALSLVVMLQPAERGGGLRLWAARYEGELHAAEHDVRAGFVSHEYGIGDAIVFESQRLHQIAPFGGDLARISITAHALREPTGRWVVWF